MDASHEAWLLLRAFIALVAVLALAVVALRFGLPWLVRRSAAAGEKQIVVEDVCLLDRGNRLYAVRWQGERLLVATSSEGARLISRRTSGPETEGTGLTAASARSSSGPPGENA